MDDPSRGEPEEERVEQRVVVRCEHGGAGRDVLGALDLHAPEESVQREQEALADGAVEDRHGARGPLVGSPQGGIAVEAVVERPGQDELDVTKRARAKRRLAGGEVELPDPHEAVVVAERTHRVDVRQKADAPLLQGVRVVDADLLKPVYGRAADIWWNENRDKLQRLSNLTILQ